MCSFSNLLRICLDCFRYMSRNQGDSSFALCGLSSLVCLRNAVNMQYRDQRNWMKADDFEFHRSWILRNSCSIRENGEPSTAGAPNIFCIPSAASFMVQRFSFVDFVPLPSTL